MLGSFPHYVRDRVRQQATTEEATACLLLTELIEHDRDWMFPGFFQFETKHDKATSSCERFASFSGRFSRWWSNAFERRGQHPIEWPCRRRSRHVMKMTTWCRDVFAVQLGRYAEHEE